jgi:hypothetical protein
MERSPISNQRPHFWIIFVQVPTHPQWGWRAHGVDDIKAYRTKKEAAHDLHIARNLYGAARLYKFKPEAFIFGGHK